MVQRPHQAQDLGTAVEKRAQGPLGLGLGDDLGHGGQGRAPVPFAIGQHGGTEPATPAGDRLVAVDDVPVLDELAQGGLVVGGYGQAGGSRGQ